MARQPGSRRADISTGPTSMHNHPLSVSKPNVIMMSAEPEPESRGLTGTKEDSWECHPTLVTVSESQVPLTAGQPAKECVQDTLLNRPRDADRSPAGNGKEENQCDHDVIPQWQSDSPITPEYELDERYKGVSGEPEACSGVTAVASWFPQLGKWRQGSALKPRLEILNGRTPTEQDVYLPHAMLSGHHPTPTSPMESPEEATAATWDVERDNEAFKILCRSRRNLVLDSVYPRIAPHIVITPADETWNDYFIPLRNRVNPQRPWYLMVVQCHPPTYLRLSSEVDEPSSNPLLMEEDSLSASHESCRPKSVFSRSRFIQLIERSSTERLIMYHVITALQRRQCKAAAFSAASVAFSFRRRYNSPDFVLALEKPFRWSDPAEPLLLNSRYHLGTTVIDSISPFLVPHIVINAPPPQSPWIAWQNATNDPQDCGYGRFLVVPAPSVTFVNAFARDFENEKFSCSDVCESTTDPFETLSRPETPTPETPLPDREEPKFFSSSYSYDDDKPFPADGSDPSLINLAIPLSDDHTCADFSRPSCSTFSDEDEDDLPPFDEWYQAIARSTQVAV